MMAVMVSKKEKKKKRTRTMISKQCQSRLHSHSFEACIYLYQATYHETLEIGTFLKLGRHGDIDGCDAAEEMLPALMVGTHKIVRFNQNPELKQNLPLFRLAAGMVYHSYSCLVSTTK